jgi:reactive intermediate/imine deaminase
MIFVSGQLPTTSSGESLQESDFATQVRQALANVFAIVRAGGSTPDRILKVTAFVVGTERSPQFNALYAEAFGSHRPARSTVPVRELANGYRVEIEAIALQ